MQTPSPQSPPKGVLRAALFGSVARGSATEASDVDHLVELLRGKTLLEIVGIQLDLEDLLGRQVDVVTYSALHPRIRERALREQTSILVNQERQ